MAHKLILPNNKKHYPKFAAVRYIGIGNFISHCDKLLTVLNIVHLHIKVSLYVYQLSRHGLSIEYCGQFSIFADISGSPGPLCGT
jgi:hypothetical protein